MSSWFPSRPSLFGASTGCDPIFSCPGRVDERGQSVGGPRRPAGTHPRTRCCSGCSCCSHARNREASRPSHPRETGRRRPIAGRARRVATRLRPHGGQRRLPAGEQDALAQALTPLPDKREVHAMSTEQGRNDDAAGVVPAEHDAGPAQGIYCRSRALQLDCWSSPRFPAAGRGLAVLAESAKMKR